MIYSKYTINWIFIKFHENAFNNKKQNMLYSLKVILESVSCFGNKFICFGIQIFLKQIEMLWEHEKGMETIWPHLFHRKEGKQSGKAELILGSWKVLNFVVSTLSNEPDQSSLWEEGVYFQVVFSGAVDITHNFLNLLLTCV